MLFVPAVRGGKMMATLQQRSRKYNPDGSKRPSLIKRVTKWNKVPASPAPLTPATEDAVRETLRPDVALLSRLLGRDLSGWLDRLTPDTGPAPLSPAPEALSGPSC